ncbi:POTE ankyrin domain family member G-like [Argopecten irradians]|uniref:POTE ankyrin domain family member G-like n=1 Tax=Argopecten irradians TaxID=31199 RepID=UPI00372449D2
MSFRMLRSTDSLDDEFSLNNHLRLCRQRSNSEPNRLSLDENGVNATDSSGRSLLFCAVRYGQVEVARGLLESRCDPNIPDEYRNIALHEAVERSHPDLVRLLIKYGSDLDAKNCLGQTPLMRAVVFDDLEIVKLLVKSGADIDEVECTGKSALLIGLLEQREKVCRFLIKYGCDVNIVDKLGQSAMYLASQSTSAESMSMCKRLMKAGYETKKDSEWLDESSVARRVLRRKSFLKKVYNKLRSRNEKDIKQKYCHSDSSSSCSDSTPTESYSDMFETVNSPCVIRVRN